MEKSSHYYGILALCLLSGVERKAALRIAYASQFVDDAKIDSISFAAVYADPLFQSSGGRTKAWDLSSCHSYFKIQNFNYQAMIRNTCLFHFFPGNGGATFTEKLRCLPAPSVLEGLLVETAQEVPLKPERLGMLLHVFADTFAHQGFSGLLSLENDVQELETDETRSIFAVIGEKLKRFFSRNYDEISDSFIPAYGHGQALNNPDIPSRSWSYTRVSPTRRGSRDSTGKIDNRDRFMKAFDAIAAILSKIKDGSVRPPGAAGADLSAFKKILTKSESTESKIKAWRNFIRTLDPQADLGYDPEEWLKDCFGNYDPRRYGTRSVEGAVLVPGYKDSSWYAFAESVQWFKAEALARLSRDGLTIPL